MYCTFCGTKNDKGNVFCINCGKRLAAETTPLQVPPQNNFEDEDEESISNQTSQEPEINSISPVEEDETAATFAEETSPEDSEQYYICPHCKNKTPTDSSFCIFCGKNINIRSEELPHFDSGHNLQEELPSVQTEQLVNCPNCQTKNNLNELFCLSCGFPLNSEEHPIESPSSVNGRPAETDHFDDPLPSSSPPLPSTAEQNHAAFEKIKVSLSRFHLHLNRKLFFILLLIPLLILAAWFAMPYFLNLNAENCTPITPNYRYSLADQYELKGELTQNSFFKSGLEYSIADNETLTIPRDVTLIIEPGARIRMGEGARILVHGELQACGKLNRKILFTANTNTGRPGYWRGIVFEDSDEASVIGNVKFEFGGMDNYPILYLENSDSLVLQNVEFDSNAYYSLSFEPQNFPEISKTFEVDNGPEGWEIRSGEITGDQIWANDQPYILNGSIKITEDAVLTIPGGAEVRFWPRSTLIVYGILKAEGTERNPIRVTSIRDSALSNSSQLDNEDWVGLQLIGKYARADLVNVEMRFDSEDTD